ncbi:MAG: DUF302 domain-containing protein [Bacteroidales bacterium]|nr:DUF302 domain-containing protein [Bacteroidales bacterium]
MNYYLLKQLETSYEEAIEKVKTELQKQGFGVLSEIKMHEKFKEKLDVDINKYTIFGACNPSFGYKAIRSEEKIGTLLPCNVVVQEKGDNLVDVAIVDPVISMNSVDNSDIKEISKQIKSMLKAAMENL